MKKNVVEILLKIFEIKLFTIFLMAFMLDLYSVFAEEFPEQLIPEFKNIGQVELLYVEGTMSNPESQNGHSALLVVPHGKKWEDGFVIEFNANVFSMVNKEKNLRYYWNGLVGNYPFFVQIRYAKEFFFKTLITDGRNIDRIIIPMTENLSKKLGDKIIQLYSNPNELGKYYFTHKNCASMILFLFDSINLKVPFKQQFLANLTNGFSPDELNSILENSLISLNPIEKILSKSNIIKSLSSYYKVKIESKIHDDTQSFMRWSDAEKYALSKMSWHELQHVASVLDETDFPRQNFVTFLLRKNPYVKGRVFKTFNFYNFPKSFYLICQNSDCADKVALDMTSVYSPDEIENLYHQISLHIKRSLNLFLPELDLKESIYTKHWSLIVSSLKKLRMKEHK